MFTDKNIEQFKIKNISLEIIEWQLEQFKKGINPIRLEKAASTKKEIAVLDNPEEYVKNYDSAELDVVKFIPASGAASRMFKDLYEFKSAAEANPNVILEDFPSVNIFFDNIKKFAFYNELNKRLADQDGVERLINGKKYVTILNCLLLESGLNYGALPKGLLSFHFYAGGIARTPFEEHLKEGAKYAYSKGKTVKLHFTVSPEHVQAFKEHCDSTVTKYEEMFDVRYEIEFSVQKSSTDTIAVLEDNSPFYDSDGDILFRPGGHGALIENLNDIDADIIFIKNIDNVVPEKKLRNTLIYKKALCGYLLETQNNLFKTIKELQTNPSEEVVSDAKYLLKEFLNIEESSIDWNIDPDVDKIVSLLNRPLRVCGVVKNVGEAGGGPFLVTGENNHKSLQIVESSQVDLSDADQNKIFNESSHFNPVDLVCGVRNYKGEKFNLSNFIDYNACFISSKSKDSKKIKALELPGLWNGAMARWNTLFVEVPLDTFNPVKSVNDLLRESHQ